MYDIITVVFHSRYSAYNVAISYYNSMQIYTYYIAYLVSRRQYRINVGTARPQNLTCFHFNGFYVIEFATFTVRIIRVRFRFPFTFTDDQASVKAFWQKKNRHRQYSATAAITVTDNTISPLPHKQYLYDHKIEW